MRPTRIPGADPTPLGAPHDWKDDQNGHCGALFVRRDQISGVEFMRSAWEVDPSEAAMLYAGARLTLGVQGRQHPVVHLQVGELPETFDPVVHARRFTRPDGRPYVRVEMLFPYGGGRSAYAEQPVTGSFSYAVSLAIAMIEQLAQTHGWTDLDPQPRT